MSLIELVKIVETNGKGVRAYVECVRAARGYLETQSHYSAAFFLLHAAAEQFIDRYDDQPLLSERAEDEFQRFRAWAEQLATAHDSADQVFVLKTLNAVAADIASHQLRDPEI